MSKISSKLNTKMQNRPVAANAHGSEFEAHLYRLFQDCVILPGEARQIEGCLRRLFEEDVISLGEVEQVENLVLLGKVLAATAIRHLTRIENVRSTTVCERSRYGMVYMLGNQVTGSGHVCRTLRV